MCLWLLFVQILRQCPIMYSHSNSLCIRLDHQSLILLLQPLSTVITRDMCYHAWLYETFTWQIWGQNQWKIWAYIEDVMFYNANLNHFLNRQTCWELYEKQMILPTCVDSTVRHHISMQMWATPLIITHSVAEIKRNKMLVFHKAVEKRVCK